jgi:hypothetical protein
MIEIDFDGTKVKLDGLGVDGIKITADDPLVQDLFRIHNDVFMMKEYHSGMPDPELSFAQHVTFQIGGEIVKHKPEKFKAPPRGAVI